MNQTQRHIEYNCTECGEPYDREILSAKKVSFHAIGVKGRMLRSRTVAWLCPRCLVRDPAWTAEAYAASPGMADIKAVSHAPTE